MRTIAGEFIQNVQGSLIFPLEEQEHIGNGKDFWCFDWWVIEIAKFFFEGEAEYRRFPRARRLLDNTNLDRDEIVRLGRQRNDILIGAKKAVAGGIKEIVVYESCRGFDSLLASIAGFKNIYVIIDSEFPMVVEKTRNYLLRPKSTDDHFKLEIIKTNGEFEYWMKTDNFLQSVKGGEK